MTLLVSSTKYCTHKLEHRALSLIGSTSYTTICCSRFEERQFKAGRCLLAATSRSTAAPTPAPTGPSPPPTSPTWTPSRRSPWKRWMRPLQGRPEVRVQWHLYRPLPHPVRGRGGNTREEVVEEEEGATTGGRGRSTMGVNSTSSITGTARKRTTEEAALEG